MAEQQKPSTSSLANPVAIEHFNRGAAHYNGGRFDEAEANFRAAADAEPGCTLPHIYRGVCLRMLQREQEAVAAFQNALRVNLDTPLAAFHLAGAYTALGMGREAEGVYRHLIRAHPDFPGAALNLGILLMRQDILEQAPAAFHLAVVVDPGCPIANNNLGAARMSLLDEDGAAVFYRRAIRLAPDNAEYNKNLGTCRIKAGDFAEGGPAYEWREEQSVWKWKRHFPGKIRWDGSPLNGRTLLVHFEQGIGDTFQFIRYLGHAKTLGAGRTIFECQKPLKRFLADTPGVDVLVRNGDPLPDFDVYAPLMSMPHLCRSTPETLPGGVPYLAAEPEKKAEWRRRIDALGWVGGRFRIGVNWHANEVNRSIPLETFEPIARIPGVRLYSLQKVVGMDQLAGLRDRLGIVDWTQEMDLGDDGFVDTAAVMANMDLIISCDSAVNHLAGAMGLPSILVARWFGDWRWMRFPDWTPWYPTMRLFRMARRNDWAGVMERVAYDVARRAAEKRCDAGRSVA